MPEWIHPVLPFLLGAALVPLLGVTGRRIVSLLAPALGLALVLTLPEDASLPVHVLGFDLELLRLDALARVMAVAFTLYAVIAGIYSWRDEGALSKAGALALAGGGVGVVCAGDLLSLLLFWETLAISSMLLVWNDRSPQALAAGYRYILFHILGGLCLLAGFVLHVGAGGSTAITAMELAGPAAWFFFFGIAINAAIPPLHAWLPDAYPRATIFGTVFLAAFTTKSAVYVLARLFPGAEPLIWLGAAMALYGVVFAVLENDIRRLLGYHIISQVGYMVCGVGIGTALALNGTAAHAFSHIFYKGLLMMSAGAVIYATGRGKLTELGNLARPLKWALVLMMIGAFSISGFPLFNGFISKAMVVSAAAEAKLPRIELMLTIASMGTFLHTGLKLPWFTFFGPPSATPPAVLRPIPASMMLAMGLTALVCIVTGVAPNLLYARLPFAVDYHPYTLDHVLIALELLVGTALGFWLLRGILGGQATTTWDADRLYRRPLALLAESSSRGLGAAFAAAERGVRALGNGVREGWRSALVALVPSALTHRIALVMTFGAALWYLAQWG